MGSGKRLKRDWARVAGRSNLYGTPFAVVAISVPLSNVKCDNCCT